MPELHAPLVLLVPVMVAGAVLWAGRSRGLGMPLAHSPRRLAGRVRVWGGHTPGLLRFAALAVLAFAVAGPYRTVTQRPDPREGVAIVVAVDVSESMAEAGLGGVRKLDAALDEAARFRRRRDSDLVGLVAFAADALVRVPPTLDQDAFLGALAALEVGKLGDGTALGTALGLAANRLRAVEARSKVLILVTDGRSNAGAVDPLTAARAAAAIGHRVYVVEVKDQDGGVPGLETVARSGGGKHFAVSDREGLEAAYREIEALEPSRFVRRTEEAEVPLSAGLLWMVLGLVLAERGVRASSWGQVP